LALIKNNKKALPVGYLATSMIEYQRVRDKRPGKVHTPANLVNRYLDFQYYKIRLDVPAAAAEYKILDRITDGLNVAA
jgi:hypothetical protein